LHGSTVSIGDLLSNVVEHACTPFRVLVELRGRTLYLAVDDELGGPAPAVSAVVAADRGDATTTRRSPKRSTRSPFVDTEAVAVERVRLGKETVTDQETVGGEVRKEEIELDNGDTRRDDTSGRR
jgi:hypothetical protein